MNQPVIFMLYRGSLSRLLLGEGFSFGRGSLLKKPDVSLDLSYLAPVQGEFSAGNGISFSNLASPAAVSVNHVPGRKGDSVSLQEYDVITVSGSRLDQALVFILMED